MKKEQQPNTLHVKNNIKTFYYQEKYKHYTKGRGNQFEKQYLLLSNIYANK